MASKAMTRAEGKAAAQLLPDAPRPGVLLPQDLIVRRCLAMIIDRTWEPGHSPHVLAKEFDCTPAYVARAHGEAKRFARIAQDAGANRLQLLVRARDIADQDGPDRLPAVALLAKMTGADKPPEAQQFTTPEERVAYLRECLRDPDDELLEALRAERDAVMAALAVETTGEELWTDGHGDQGEPGTGTKGRHETADGPESDSGDT